MEKPGFWDNPGKSTRVTREIKNLKGEVEIFRELGQEYDDIQVMIQMGYEGNDTSLIPEIEEMLSHFTETLEKMRMKLLLPDEYDANNATLCLNAGAGGTESCDWCSVLYWMHYRWAEKEGFKTEVLDFPDGDEAGIKSVTVQINGESTYDYLRSEHGAHRLVRILLFNVAGRRQIPFMPRDVMPDIKEDIDIEINPDDIRIGTYRSSGAGGQHINRTSSAIRTTHFPTGTVVTCQNKCFQFQNKDKATQILRSRLFMPRQREQATKIAGIRSDVKENDRGSRIRPYVLQPYTTVKDHRTGEESGNVDAMLDGGPDPFISAYLRWMDPGHLSKNNVPED